jgi:hypothetical protein
MQTVAAETIARILAITDALGIHREAVRIPLGPTSTGGVRVTKFVEITVAEDVEPFLAGLRDRLAALDLSRIKQA